jgi:hypothetical protein
MAEDTHEADPSVNTPSRHRETEARRAETFGKNGRVIPVLAL